MAAGRKSRPRDIDEDFLRWVKAFGRNRGGKGGAAGDVALPSFRISDAARARAAAQAPGESIEKLESRYRAWVALQGEIPRYPDRAFPAWVAADQRR